MLASSELDSLSIEQVSYRKRLVFGGVFLISQNRGYNSKIKDQFIVTWLVDLINNNIIGSLSYKLFDPFFARALLSGNFAE